MASFYNILDSIKVTITDTIEIVIVDFVCADDYNTIININYKIIDYF